MRIQMCKTRELRAFARSSNQPMMIPMRLSPRQSLALAVSVALAAVACAEGGSDENRGDGQDDPSSTSPGPLALAENVGGPEALTSGTLRVTNECVLLNEQGDEALLVWPADRTSWDPESGRIRFELDDARRVELADGDAVTLGGGGASVTESGRPAEELISDIEWVAEPAASCIRDAIWSVGNVTLEQR